MPTKCIFTFRMVLAADRGYFHENQYELNLYIEAYYLEDCELHNSQNLRQKNDCAGKAQQQFTRRTVSL
jgi:hypothetical protein